MRNLSTLTDRSIYCPSLRGSMPGLQLGLLVTRTSPSSVMRTEACTRLAVSRGLVADIQSPGVQVGGDLELLPKASDSIKSMVTSNLELMELLTGDPPGCQFLQSQGWWAPHWYLLKKYGLWEMNLPILNSYGFPFFQSISTYICLNDDSWKFIRCHVCMSPDISVCFCLPCIWNFSNSLPLYTAIFCTFL